MKKGIHPKSYKIKVIMTGHDEFHTISTLGREDKEVVIHLESHPRNHQAWLKDQAGRAVRKNSSAAKFRKKFGDLGLFAE